ncbi:ABC-ATPase domain-containing protein [Corynebacterium heidelbergense]|uniref:ATPase of the ABC class n=1 Tax=Corynebacterium heidelbergense TaxID=2055947 RepID=A0A364V571_9CORY|nr:ABC-ATPase domain-containing protein [Corynebacterium heidelbergense]RAV31758.1 ATPase of the ABC class [Corynebacterium heidelbergense]
MTSLASTLAQLDGASYGAYKRLSGLHQLDDDLRLSVDKVQSDPFAPPSLIQVIVPLEIAGLPDNFFEDATSARATTDQLARYLSAAIARHGAKSGGKADGHLSIDAPSQQVLERASVVRDLSGPSPVLRLRLEAALPARGRRIMGHAARRLLTEALPDVVDEALMFQEAPGELASAIQPHLDLARDQNALREQLPGRGLVGFIADGAVLPRAAGNSDLPLDNAVPFAAPESLRASFDLPSGRTVTGMGIPAGVTLIVGGGYHGKSTVLRALELGVYDHVRGDGREFAIADPTAVSLRAEDGRAVTNVDVSPFIRDLPSGADTREFRTTNASGSTSQAAGLIEALEAGARTLLIDEDTSATNFMIRDERMRRLVPSTKEPITPLIDHVRGLWEDHGVSTVLVAGGSGAFIDAADTVIQLDAYQPVDVTSAARDLADPSAVAACSHPIPGGGSGGHGAGARVVVGLGTGQGQGRESRGSRGNGDSRGPRGPRGPMPPQAKGLDTIRVGDVFLDLGAVKQLVDVSQTRAIAAALARIDGAADGRATLPELVDRLFTEMERGGVEALSPHRGHPGRLVLPRRQEIAAAVNRLRSAVIRQRSGEV